MSATYETFDAGALTALTNYMKVTRNKAVSNETSINSLSGDLVALSEETVAALLEKQDNLTFDSTPTAGSSNPVTSGGVATYISNKCALSATHDGAGNVTLIMGGAN